MGGQVESLDLCLIRQPWNCSWVLHWAVIPNTWESHAWGLPSQLFKAPCVILLFTGTLISKPRSLKKTHPLS